MDFLEKIAPRATDDDVCEACGQRRQDLFDKPVIPYRPWRMTNAAEIAAYTAGLADETIEWLIAFYVDDDLGLLSAETVARGTVSGVRFKFRPIIYRGLAIGATGLILVHNHPSGDPTPSAEDVAVTIRFAQVSRECELPLLIHLVVAAKGMLTVGYW